MIGPKRFP